MKNASGLSFVLVRLTGIRIWFQQRLSGRGSAYYQTDAAAVAIPTTAGTGSEVGRSAAIILAETGKKAIFFHPDLIPDIAILDPALTVGLPPKITAATGIDAFVHNLEACFSPGLHPMADGIALQGPELVLGWLPKAVFDGQNLDARERMLVAAAMGATAFQKGPGRRIANDNFPLDIQSNSH
ncbi:MAG: iron-containing alcohol dehydrogenase [Dissulfuribacterales bacterium]